MTVSCPRRFLSLFHFPCVSCLLPTHHHTPSASSFLFLYPLGPTGHPAPSALIPDLGLSPQGLSVPGRLLYWQFGPSGAHLLRSPHRLCLLSSHQLRVSARHTHPSRLPPGLLPRLSVLLRGARPCGCTEATPGEQERCHQCFCSVMPQSQRLLRKSLLLYVNPIPNLGLVLLPPAHHFPASGWPGKSKFPEKETKCGGKGRKDGSQAKLTHPQYEP